ncbi:MAG: 5'-nucleotidase C-terminal domain-containing protein [Oscillospiraceae bacterium]|nr:5'-nucleotidase C-terminal domain-containing protein [Oscillospiraceae bacterium]
MKRKTTSLLLVLILILSLLSACSSAPANEEITSTPIPALTPPIENTHQNDEETPPNSGSLTILHMNDTHGRTQAEPYISQLANDIRADGGNVLILDAGDRLHGQVATNLTEGETMVQVMNAVGYDAMVTGNHEYNFGLNRLIELSGMMDFPLLAANVRFNGEYIFERYTIIDYENLTVGVFGLGTPETPKSSDPRNMGMLVFEDPVEIATEIVELLKERNCDIIIALTHLGDDNSTAENERSDALAAIDGIDVVLDGHSHTLLENGKVVGNTLIAQTGSHAQYIGIVEIMIENGVKTKEAHLIEVPDADDETELKADEAIIAVIAEGQARVESITSVVVGTTPVTLDGERESVRTGETNLANLVTDSMIFATGADMSFIGGGSIRTSISAGDITMGDVLTVLPFSNLIITLEMTGLDVLEILEHGVSEYPEPAGLFIQVAGIHFMFDPEAEPGQRVVSVVMADGTAFDVNSSYIVATVEFIAAGGDGYTMMARGMDLVFYGGDAEAFVIYLETNPVITAEPEGRVRIQDR